MRLISLHRFRNGSYELVKDWVAEEGLLVLRIHGVGVRRYVITPEKVREFVYGHLLGAGLIRQANGVVSYREGMRPETGMPGEVIEVEVSLSAPPKLSVEEAGWATCGSEVPRENAELRRLTPYPLISDQELIKIPELAAERSEDFRLTGAYHYAFLFDPGLRLRAVAKDIGRHNAVDKAIGHALLEGFTFEESVLYTTGRITGGIVVKALRAGIPVVASRGAALLGAVVLARRYNVGLVGFLRGKRFNLYAGEGWLSRT